MNSEEYAGKERRRFTRIDANIDFKIMTTTDFFSEERKIVTANISRGGILFNFNKEIPVSSVLSLEFDMPNMEKNIGCYGKIVRTNKKSDDSYKMGCNFINIKESDRLAIGKFIGMVLASREN